MISDRDDGFTLVEVLVAFAILALTLTMVFRSFGDGARGIQVSQRQAAAVALAEAKLAALGVERPLVQGVTKGVDTSGMEWRVDIQALQEFDEFARATGLQAVHVSVFVSWPATGRPARTVELSTLKFANRR